MAASPVEGVEWLPPWTKCHAGLEAELAREVGAEHALAGCRAVSVGRRVDRDDVLFWLPEGPSPFAVVHLTFSGARETRSEWPWTELYSSLDDWVTRRMRPDRMEFEAERDPPE